jgi:FlaA1/EpsC-like NDP-sugar epimerase
MQLRFEFSVPEFYQNKIIGMGLILSVSFSLTYFVIIKIFGRPYMGSFEDSIFILFAAFGSTIAGVFFMNINYLLPYSYSLLIISSLLGISFVMIFRIANRYFSYFLAQKGKVKRVLLYGAGINGKQIVNQMLSDHNSELYPIAFIDDNPEKKNLLISGVRVIGDFNKISALVKNKKLEVLVVTFSKIDSELLKMLDKVCTPNGIQIRLVPSLSDILNDGLSISKIEDMSDEDLLGRKIISTDELAIKNFIQNKNVLITGAGGSIGSEIARQVMRYSPSNLGLLDRDETTLLRTQLSIDGNGLLNSENLFLADIRDAARLNDIFLEFKPDIVFHAAALKHLQLLENNPSEAQKTNVEGTQNIINAALTSNVKVFVNISTDKAADPVSILGKSKLLTELLVASAKSENSSRFMSVRFGNVLGSRGSVMETFREQIKRGGPLTVTHPEVERYFMTIPEAVHLVLQASVIGEYGETLILDMGNPVKILDIAKQLISRSNKNIDVVFTGLRSGEKIREELMGKNEQVIKKVHPQITHIRVSQDQINFNL